MEDGSLAYDGEGWLKDSNGNYILDDNKNRVGAKGIETGLIKILRLDPANADDVKKVQDMMTAAGLQHRVKEGEDSEDRSAWYWDGSVEEWNSEITIGQNLLAPMGMVHLPAYRYSVAEITIASYVKRTAVAATTPIDVQYGYPMQWQIASGEHKAETGVTENTWCNRVSYRTDEVLLGVEAASKIMTKGPDTLANDMGTYLRKR
jgi:hypothetical protein